MCKHIYNLNYIFNLFKSYPYIFLSDSGSEEETPMCVLTTSKLSTTKQRKRKRVLRPRLVYLITSKTVTKSTFRLGKFISISGRQRTTKIQNLVVHNYLLLSLSVFLYRTAERKEK